MYMFMIIPGSDEVLVLVLALTGWNWVGDMRDDTTKTYE